MNRGEKVREGVSAIEVEGRSFILQRRAELGIAS
jgi:hypothetical protein